MKEADNEKLLKMLENAAGQLALAESFKQPRKEKQYERQMLEIEKEILKRLDTYKNK